MRISDWSADVCSSDLWRPPVLPIGNLVLILSVDNPVKCSELYWSSLTIVHRHVLDRPPNQFERSNTLDVKLMGHLLKPATEIPNRPAEIRVEVISQVFSQRDFLPFLVRPNVCSRVKHHVNGRRFEKRFILDQE